MIEKNSGSLSLTVDQMVKQLSRAYISIIKSKASLKSFPSVMLWGPPGVGKSQGIRQIANEIADQTGKRVEITDVRLLLFNPVDLRGIPTANEDKTLAVWLKPKIFQMDDSNEVINILFLDEISAAPQSVQAAAYQITLDKTVGEHRLPDNCIVIAAGNRITDRSVAFAMPKALANRLCHIEIISDIKSWHDWAVCAGVNSVVLGFLDYNPSLLMKFDSATDSLSFPTPLPFESIRELMSIIPYGGGGTDFRVIFDYIRRNCIGELPACIVIFTDGYGPYPPKEQTMNIPVLWLINNFEITPPFGKQHVFYQMTKPFNLFCVV